MRQHADADAVARHPLADKLLGCVLGKRRSQGFRSSQTLRVEQAQHGTAPRRLQLGQAHTVSREHAGQRVDEHASKPERVGDQAGMLPSGAAECIQHIVGDVVAPLHRDGQDRIRHVLHGDADEAVGDLRSLAAIADLGGERGEALPHDLGVERLILRWPEDLREEFGDELARHDIGVGDGERSAAPVTGRPRIGAC